MTTPALLAIDGARWFQRSEFPDTVRHCKPELIHKLDEMRSILGYPIHPSPVPGAWVRTDGSKTSRHYIDHADAGDIFPMGCPVLAYHAALLTFSGVGIYFDTTYNGHPRPMLHVDLREKPTTWFRERGEYFYPNHDLAARHKLMTFLTLWRNHERK